MRVTKFRFLIQSQPQSFCFCVWSVRFRHEISFAGRFWIFKHFDIHWSRPEMNCWPTVQMRPADFFRLAPKIFILLCFKLKHTPKFKFRVFYIKSSFSGTLGCISVGQVFCPEPVTWLALQMVCAVCRSPQFRLSPLHSALCLHDLCTHLSLQSLVYITFKVLPSPEYMPTETCKEGTLSYAHSVFLSTSHLYAPVLARTRTHRHTGSIHNRGSVIAVYVEKWPCIPLTDICIYQRLLSPQFLRPKESISNGVFHHFVMSEASPEEIFGLKNSVSKAMCFQ